MLVYENDYFSPVACCTSHHLISCSMKKSRILIRIVPKNIYNQWEFRKESGCYVAFASMYI